MATKEEILDSIANLTVLELSELLKDFEERFGVTAAAPVAAAAAPAGGARTISNWSPSIRSGAPTLQTAANSISTLRCRRWRRSFARRCKAR